MVYENFHGDRISKMGLGTLRIKSEDNGTVDYEEMQKIIDICMQNGITYYDTAYDYMEGSSELGIARCLVEKYPRSSFFLADKIHVHSMKSTAEDFFNEQLDRTKATYFDYYLAHGITDEIANLVEERKIFDLLQRKKADGLIRFAGASFHTSYETFEYFMRKYDSILDFVQLPSSYYHYAEETLKKQYNLALEMGKPVIGMTPLMGGFLSNIDNEVAARNLNVLNDKYAVTNSGIGMAFASSNPGCMCVLSGITTAEQATENIALFNSLPILSESDRELLIKTGEFLAILSQLNCTKCGYCRKCPVDIKIPEIIAEYNRILGSEGDPLKRLAEICIEKEYIVAECIGCNKCQMACPQMLQCGSFIQTLCDRIDSDNLIRNYPEYTPVKPVAYELDGKIVSDLLEIHIAADNKEMNGRVNHIIGIRMLQKLSGEVIEKGWAFLKDDNRTDYIIPLQSYENGIYEILIHSYYEGEKDGSPFRYYSEPSVYCITLFKKQNVSITHMTDYGSSVFEYGHIPFMQEDIKTYLNHIVDNEMVKVEKGMLLELGIMHSFEGLYHKVKASLVIDGVDQQIEREIIFPLDKDGNQISGNKSGVVIIPADLSGTEDITVKIQFEEYSDKDFQNEIDSVIEVLELSSFKQAVYLDFSEKKPSIYFSQKKEGRLCSDVVNIYFKDVQDDKHRTYIRVNEEDSENDWTEINSAHHQVILDKKGTFTIQAMVSDREGCVLAFKEDTRVIQEKVKAVISHEEKAIRGGKLSICSKVETELKIECVELMHKETGNLILLKEAAPGDYHGIYLIPEKVPTGTHILIATFTLSDGSKVVTTSTFMITK